ncbi:MAG TPA: hypothetical protein VMJ93_04420 [Verrucomicrobiae bacterium]|nr:hypothetical protein [Verrucomicrobiae bacterium]
MASPRRSGCNYLAPLFVAAFFAAVNAAPAHVKSARIHLAPLLVKGETIRYRIDTQASIGGATTSPIMNPEGAKNEDRSTSLEIRLDVLDAPSASAGGAGGARLRVTYDLAHAASSSDAYDPGVTAFDEAYDKLEGHSMEFTMSPTGGISGVSGLEDIFSNPSVAQSMKDWMTGFSYSEGVPKEGIEIGQKWSREIPAENLPLRGLFWRVESTYLRNESCSPQPDFSGNAPGENPTPDDARKPDLCAVILTESTLDRHGSAHGEETPDDYLHNGLRTSGTWNGTAESLDSISLRSGWIVVSTATVSEKMDYEIKSVQSGSALHHTGAVNTQTHIAMLTPSSAPSPSPGK